MKTAYRARAPQEPLFSWRCWWTWGCISTPALAGFQSDSVEDEVSEAPLGLVECGLNDCGVSQCLLSMCRTKFHLEG